VAHTIGHLLLTLAVLFSQYYGVTILVLDIDIVHVVASTWLLIILIAIHGIGIL
jgi:hypothetical protein